MRKFLLLFSIVALIVLLVNKPLILEEEITFRSVKSSAAPVEDVVGEPISEREINSFLAVWPKFANSWVSRIGANYLSLTTTDNPEKKMPYITRIWINRQGWEVNRFFYVEQRLKAIVASLKAEDRANDTIKVLESQLGVQTNPSAVEGIRRLINAQKDLMNIEKVTQAERNSVRPHLNEIADLLYPTE